MTIDDSGRRYAVNRNRGADDVLHCNPGEECNLDDAEDRWTIDQVTALKMKAAGTARLCKHCIDNWPKEEPTDGE